MCGIIGYTGHQQASPILVEALNNLEYRGYDSAGISVFKDNKTHETYRTAGKVETLKSRDADSSTTKRQNVDISKF